MSAPTGIVYLVGAGPGDPGLITVRGLRLLRQADVVIYDRLIGRELLAEVKHGAVITSVAKTPGSRRAAQNNINDLLIEHAKDGRLVVRLKGGDPFVFGRGFEEMSACREAGVECLIVPGVSSAFAGPAAAGIPITERRTVRSLAIITARMVGGETIDVDTCRSLAAVDTLIVLMGRDRLHEWTKRLIDTGRKPTVPAACIQWATTPLQRTIVATLGTIADEADRNGLTFPIVTVIGEVARHADRHDPSVFAPLTRRRIVLTRPSSGYATLQQTLSVLGAATLPCPLLRFAEPDHYDELDAALAHRDRYEWLLFPSRHAVRGLWRRMEHAGLDARALAGSRIVAFGAGTIRAMKRIGLTPDVAPNDRDAKAVVERMLIGTGGKLGTVLLPCSDQPHERLVEELTAAGATVVLAQAYRVLEASPSDVVLDVMREGMDAIVLANPSCARRFGELGVDTKTACVLCIGEATARAAQRAGLRADITVPTANTADVATALSEQFSSAQPTA